VLVGERILTGSESRVTLQWARGAGVMLRGRSEVELRRLDSQGQVLALRRGQLIGEMDPAAGRQRLTVTAGPIRVKVTGTQFAVALEHKAVDVKVYRGAVRVLALAASSAFPEDGVVVSAGFHLRVEREGRITSALEPLTSRQAPRVHLQPWPSLHRVLAASGLLAVQSTPSGATVRLDSVEVGPTDLTVRGAPGRHLVELVRGGEVLRREWVLFRPSNTRRLELASKAPRAQSGSPVLPTAIYETFRAQAPEIRRCYERGLKRDPELSGELSLRLSIDRAGKVEQVGLDEDSLGDATVAACIATAVQRWSFPAGDPVEVVYPLALTPVH
jgi:hypothetical protein